MNIKNYFIKEDKKQIQINNFDQLYDSIFTNGYIDVNKIYNFIPYVRITEQEMYKIFNKNNIKQSSLTPRQIMIYLKNIGTKHNDIFSDRIVYTFTYDNDNDKNKLWDFVEKHNIYTFDYHRNSDRNQVDMRIFYYQQLAMFFMLRLKDEYAKIKGEPLVKIQNLHVDLSNFLLYLNTKKYNILKITTK